MSAGEWHEQPNGLVHAQPLSLCRARGNRGVCCTHAQVDPHAKNVGKMEEEVPALFKRLRYPFPISKSALFAVGSPHTWPGLLAALAWLVELLCYEEKAVRAQRCGFPDSRRECLVAALVPGTSLVPCTRSACLAQ